MLVITIPLSHINAVWLHRAEKFNHRRPWKVSHIKNRWRCNEETKKQYCSLYRIYKSSNILNNCVVCFVEDRGWLALRYRTEYEVSTNRNRPTTTNEDPQTQWEQKGQLVRNSREIAMYGVWSSNCFSWCFSLDISLLGNCLGVSMQFNETFQIGFASGCRRFTKRTLTKSTDLTRLSGLDFIGLD